ncbi:MAG: TPM domain-containing protein [Ruminococcaceae bacterium]|nr:TPM domain-containing protein [Oscillospiraceae bacterium]
MKKVISLLFFVFMCLNCVLPCFGAEFENPPVVDKAGYLTESQLEELSEKLEDIRQTYNFEVAVVTEREMSGFDAMSTAEDIYDYQGYGVGENDDGILLYICSETREYYITTHGDGQRVFNQRGIEYLKKNIQEELENNHYYLVMDVFADLSNELLEMAEKGEPYHKKQISTTYFLVVLGCALLIPLIVAAVMTNRKLAKMKTAVRNDYAVNYMKAGSRQLDVSRDIFLYSNIVKTEKPKNNAGSHTSSSGRTHGGGGGSF